MPELPIGKPAWFLRARCGSDRTAIQLGPITPRGVVTQASASAYVATLLFSRRTPSRLTLWRPTSRHLPVPGVLTLGPLALTIIARRSSFPKDSDFVARRGRSDAAILRPLRAFLKAIADGREGQPPTPWASPRIAAVASVPALGRTVAGAVAGADTPSGQSSVWRRGVAGAGPESTRDRLSGLLAEPGARDGVANVVLGRFGMSILRVSIR